MFDGLNPAAQGFLVPSSDLLRWADRVRPHVVKMADGSGGRYEASDIFAALAAGRMLLWIVLDGPELLCVMLTEIVQYPRRRAMRCVGVSGSRPKRWMHLLAHAEATARDRLGCDLMEAFHQFGHERLLQTGGWTAFHVLSDKSL